MGRFGASTRVGLFLAAFFAAGAVQTAYLPLWLADRGFSAGGIGQVLGAAALSRVVAVPAWGWLADRLRRERFNLFVAASFAALCAAGLPGAPGPAAVAVLVVVGGVAASALTPLADAVTLALAAVRRLDYGRTRAWGSVSYMVVSAAAGALLGRTGSWVVPWLLACGYGAAALVAPALPRAEHAPSRGGPHGVARLARSFRLALLATALVQGSHAAYYGFASLHWRASGIPDGVIGLLIAEGIVAEIALFVWGRGLVERLGPAGLTGLAAGCCLVRWSVTAFTVAVPVLAVVQVLHAGTFACQHLSSMMVLRTLPPGRAGVAQTLLASLGFSAPSGVLMWASGRIYGQADGLVFLVMAGVGGSALLVAPLLPGAARRR